MSLWILCYFCTWLYAGLQIRVVLTRNQPSRKNRRWIQPSTVKVVSGKKNGLNPNPNSPYYIYLSIFVHKNVEYYFKYIELKQPFFTEYWEKTYPCCKIPGSDLFVFEVFRKKKIRCPLKHPDSHPQLWHTSKSGCFYNKVGSGSVFVESGLNISI